jgi:hypothetical protein
MPRTQATKRLTFGVAAQPAFESLLRRHPDFIAYLQAPPIVKSGIRRKVACALAQSLANLRRQDPTGGGGNCVRASLTACISEVSEWLCYNAG